MEKKKEMEKEKEMQRRCKEKEKEKEKATLLITVQRERDANKKRLFSAISGGDVSLPARRCQRCKRLLLRENAPEEEEETIEFEAEEREENDSEESNTYDVLVEGERLVVSKEVRDALLKKEEEISPSECVSFVNNDFDSKLCEDLVRGFVTSMSKNGVNAEMSVTPFLAKKLKVKALLKWIVGPAVARNRASRMLPPLH